MKAEILKLAGAKNDADFYNMFPTEAEFMAKYGKKLEKLKKAQGGIEVPQDALDPQMPFDPSYEPGTKGAFGGIDKYINSDIGGTAPSSSSSSSNKKGFDYGNLAGAAIEAYQDGQANSTYNKKLDQYLDISKLIGQIPPKKQPKPDYLRPESQLVTGATPKGIAAKKGAKVGGNPTEIQNMYNVGDLYTDLGNTNPKQYGIGGELANVNAGWNNNGVTGNMSPGWKAASKAASFIPLVGEVVDFMGQTEANEQAGMMAKKQATFYNNLASSALQNVNAGQFSANVKYGGSFDSMEEGGWVSHDWQPQVITKFGDLDVSQVHSFAHDGMPQYRAGGHLQQYTPPSAEALQTFGEGGQLQTLWGGGIKDGGVNPYVGPLGIFSGGYHSQAAKDAPGQKGIGVQYGDRRIEAENYEGVVELANGGKIDPSTGEPSKSAYIFGAEKIQGWAKKAIEDSDIKIGTTFKHYFNQKSKLQKKLNKQEMNAKEEAANLELDGPIAKLRANAIEKTLEGIKMQNMNLAKHITNAAAVQTAINETDEEMGTAKYGGVLKKAAFGAKLTTAATGANLSGLDPAVSGLINLLKRKGYDLQVTSGLRKGAKTKSGNDSRHGAGEAVDVQFPKLGSKAYYALTKDADIVKYMMDKGLTAINEYDPKIRRQTGGSGPHVHFGKDSGTSLADRFRNAVGSTYESIKDAAGIASDFISNNLGTPQVKKNASDLYIKPKAKRADINAPKKVPVYKQPGYVNTPPQGAAPVTQAPVFDALDLEVNRRNQALLAPKRAANAPVFPSPMDNNGDYYMSDSEYEPIQSSSVYQPSVASASGFPSPMDEQGNYYMPDSEYTPIEQQAYQEPTMQQMQPQAQQQMQQDYSPVEDYSPIQQTSPSSPRAGNSGSGFSKGLERVGNNLLTGLNSALPSLRPSNQRPMDPEAFTGEMFALATNQLEPVQAQKFVPYLSQGIQISLQDQLNEVTAQTRAAERMARGNPEALAMIAAQAYDAKNKIKGEEFRLNQGEKQRVAETNRQVLNEANKMNLGIMDEQYVRQQTAKSKTKEQAVTALNSISDKILKNKFENKELGVYENMYGFRFGPNGQAYNTNIANYNIPNVGNGATSLTELTQSEIKKVLDDAKKAKSKNIETKGQGGIVKSMHEL